MIRELRLKNFRQHRDTTISFPERGSVGLLGANAAGKSTIIEALAWAFYGGKAARGTRESLRWKGAAPRNVAQVEVLFGHAGHTYRVVRKENSAELYENSSAAPRAAGSEAVSQEIATILGMSLEEFMATYFCTQQDLARLGKMGPTERTQFVLRVMQVDQIDQGIEEARTRRNSLTSEKRGIVAGIGDRDPLEAELTAAAEALVLHETTEREAAVHLNAAREKEATTGLASSALEAAREQYDASTACLVRATDRASEIAGQIVSLESEIAEARGAQGRLDEATPRLARLEELRAERDQLVTAAAQAEHRRALTHSLGQATAAITEMLAQESQFTATLAAHDPRGLASAERARQQADNTLRALRQQRESQHAVALAAGKAAAEQIQKAQTRLTALREQGSSGSCPTCTRALGEQYRAVISTLEAELEASQHARQTCLASYSSTKTPSDDERAAEVAFHNAEARLRAARKAEEEATTTHARLEALRENLTNRRAEATRLQRELASLAEAHTDPDRPSQLEAEIQALQVLERTIGVDRASAARLPTLSERLTAAQDRLLAVRTEAAQAEHALSDSAFSPDAYKEAVGLHHAAQDAARQAEQAHTRASADVRAANQRLGRADRALAEYDERAGRLRRITERVRLLDETIEALVTFRTQQAEAIRPELQERTARYIHILTDGRYPDITMDESFGVRLIDGDTEMEVVSGGSEDIAALAIRLALGEMIAERSGKPLSLLVLDEPFASLAEQWRANVLNLIDDLKDRFEQTILITHHVEVRDSVDVPVLVEYSEAEGCSQLAA